MLIRADTKTRKLLLPLCLIIGIAQFSIAQTGSVSFTSQDTGVEKAFNWAKQMALHYRGNAKDPVGPWYESALPPRYAFCMRDVSHQCVGADILGMDKENLNMFGLFVSNISASKNWCSFWEMNKWNKPAPEDYRNDQEFWYNLPANFDLMNACFRLYQWTGNTHYINDPDFSNFQEKTVNEYIDQWRLQPDSLISRSAHPNAPVPFNESDSFNRCRGLPSYAEAQPDIKMGVDLVASIYRGLLTYSSVLSLKGHLKEADRFKKLAESYHKQLESDWWNQKEGRYYTFCDSTGSFGNDEGETFLLWFDALRNKDRIDKTFKSILAASTNVENTSYYPLIFYRYGRWDDARKYLLWLADPSTKRREYPEVSFGVIEGIVQGLMGISPDASLNTITTLYRSDHHGSSSINNLNILGTKISLTHKNSKESMLFNHGNKTLKWKVAFNGKFNKALINNKKTKLKSGFSDEGTSVSYLVVIIQPHQKTTVRAL
jgi:hypothetical protein